VLTQLSYFWFEQVAHLTAHHLTARAGDPLPPELEKFSSVLARRSMVVQKTQPLAIECVVRGYLTGSGWKDYQKTGCVCGIKLPSGLQNSCRLPAPVFTPATKAERATTKTFPLRRPAGLSARTWRKRRAIDAENLLFCRGIGVEARDHHRRHQAGIWVA